MPEEGGSAESTNLRDVIRPLVPSSGQDFRVICVLLGSALLLCLVAVPQARAAGAASRSCQVAQTPAPVPEPSPLVVDADQVTFDDIAQVVEATGHVKLAYQGVTIRADFVRAALAEQRLEARGHVVIVDSTGRELTGDELTYDARAQVVEVTSAETFVNGVHIRSDRIRGKPGLIVAGESTLTTCNPANPLFRVSASRIEVVPGDRATLYGATFWVGRHGLFTLPSAVILLRSRKETAGSFPSAGYTNTDGLYAAYRYAFFVGEPLAYITPSLGTLAQRAEAGVLLQDYPLGSLPLSMTASASAGWHRELGLNVETTRLQYIVELQTSDIPLGPQTDWQSSWKWTDAAYATKIFDPNGDRQSILRLHSTVTHHLAADATLALGYNVLRRYGLTPLALDAVDPEDLIDEVRLEYQKKVQREDGITTTFRAGAFVDYLPEPVLGLTGTTSVYAAYGERVPRQHHWEAGTEYNLDTQAVTLIADTGVALGTDTYFSVQARFNAATTLFEDLDYIVTAQIRDCFDLSVKYRQVRQRLEISLGISELP